MEEAKASRIAVVYRGAQHPEYVFAPLEPCALRSSRKPQNGNVWKAVVTLPCRWTKEDLCDRIRSRVDTILKVLMGVSKVVVAERRAFRTLDRNLRRQCIGGPCGLVTTATATARYTLKGGQFGLSLNNNNVEQEEGVRVRGGELRMLLLEARTWGVRNTQRAGRK